MSRIVVLHDGETYSTIDKCMVVEFPNELVEQLDEAGDPRYLISEIMAGNVPGRVTSIEYLDDSMVRLTQIVERIEKNGIFTPRSERSDSAEPSPDDSGG